jgi:hypothetical protein
VTAVIHLTRNVCDACAVWCQFDVADWGSPARENPTNVGGDWTNDPALADCVACLEYAWQHGLAAKARLSALRAPADDGSTALPEPSNPVRLMPKPGRKP